MPFLPITRFLSDRIGRRGWRHVARGAWRLQSGEVICNVVRIMPMQLLHQGGALTLYTGLQMDPHDCLGECVVALICYTANRADRRSARHEWLAAETRRVPRTLRQQQGRCEHGMVVLAC